MFLCNISLKCAIINEGSISDLEILVAGGKGKERDPQRKLFCSPSCFPDIFLIANFSYFQMYLSSPWLLFSISHMDSKG